MIRYRVTLTSPLPKVRARAATLDWLQAIGYRTTSPPFLTSVVMERGSWVGNFGSLSPRNWRATVEGTFKEDGSGCEVSFAWAFTTAGQVCTRADIAFFRHEIEQTLGVAVGMVPDLANYKKQSVRAQNGDTWRALVFTVALLGPLAAGWIATTLASVGIGAATVCGGACYLVLRAPRSVGEIQPPTAAEVVPPPHVASPPVRPG